MIGGDVPFCVKTWRILTHLLLRRQTDGRATAYSERERELLKYTDESGCRATAGSTFNFAVEFTNNDNIHKL